MAVYKPLKRSPTLDKEECVRGEEEVDFRFTVIQSAMWLEKERGAIE